jgi:DNA polymerase III subunit delta'
MTLVDVVGHGEVRASLARAAERGRLSQSILLHGPAGTGKERLALWLGQLLLCGDPVASGPCGRCQSCAMARRLEHPDLHWFFPLPRPGSMPPEKQREKLEEQRAEELAQRRGDPLHRPRFDKAPAYFVGAVHTLRTMAASRPAMGRRQVFVVGDAELMVPQESSQEAANAFLKLLEEPPADTTLVLTTHRPGSLLPTILSRVLAVRVPALAPDEIARFLQDHAGVEAGEAERLAARADGSLGRVLDRLGEGGDGDADAQAQRLLAAVLDPRPVSRLSLALAQGPFGARGEDFQQRLDALAVGLRDLAAVAVGGKPPAGAPVAGVLDRRGGQPLPHPARIKKALDRVDEVRRLAFGNVNPQLLLADLLIGLHRDLVESA